MNSIIQQTLVNHLAQTRIHYGSHEAIDAAVRSIEALPVSRRPMDLLLFRGPDHHDRNAIEIVARAHTLLGPDSWHSVAARLSHENNMHRRIQSLDAETDLGRLHDFVLTPGEPIDSALLSYAAAISIQNVFEKMAEERRYKFLHAGLLFVQGAVKAFVGETRRPLTERHLPAAHIYEAAGDAALDNLTLLHAADSARALDKLPIPPLPRTVALCHAMALKAFETAESYWEAAFRTPNPTVSTVSDEAPVRLAEVKAKKAVIRERSRLQSERHVQIRKEAFQDQIHQIFNPPPSVRGEKR